MKKKLIFLTSQNLNSWNQKRWNLLHLAENFDFEYWNEPFKSLEVQMIEDTDSEVYENKIKIIKFRTYFHFISQLLRLPKDSFLLDYSSIRGFKLIIHVLIKNFLFFRGVKFISISFGIYPDTQNSTNYKTFFRKIFKKDYIISKILFQLLKIARLIQFYKFHHHFISGSLDIGDIPEKQITYSHALDYNFFITLKNIKKPIQKNYIAYLDQKYINHPEFKFLREPNYIDSNSYKHLHNFFEKLCSAQKKDIVFCAHPRAKKNEDYLKAFNNVKFNETAIYTKYADLVVVHDSQSINFPVLFKKPIILLALSGMEMTNKRDNLYLTGELLGCKVIDIKNLHDINLDETYDVDEAKYNEYIKKYIKFKGEEINSWEILSKKLYEI